MMPVTLLAVAPMFVWLNVVREADSTFSTAMSLFSSGNANANVIEARRSG